MPKHRIFELAKEFDTTSKVVLDILTRNNIEVKNHMSSVDDNVKDLIGKTFARKAAEVEKPKTIEVRQPQKEVKVVDTKKVTEQVKKEAEPVKNTPEKIVFTPSPVKKSYNDRQFAHKPNSYQNNNAKKDFADKPRYEQNANRNFQSNQQRPQQTNNQGNAQRPLFQPNQQRPQQHNNQGNAQRPPYQPNQQRPQQYNNQGNTQKSPYQQNQQRPQQNNNQGSVQRPPYQQNQQRPQQYNNQGNAQRSPYQNNPNNQNRPNYAPRKDFSASARPVANDNKRVFVPDTKPPEVQQNKFFNPQKKKQKGFDKKFDKEKTDNLNKNKNAGKPSRAGAFIMPTVNKHKPTSIEIPESISVKDFAEITKREVAEVIKALMHLGVMATINQEIDFDTASLVGGEFNVEVIALPPEQDPTEIPEIEDDLKKHVHRAPVVTIMGHVDHGKTSLLDTIRKTNVTAREAGGITQHIGAYQVHYQGKKIVFLDTPGHEAFTSMRARGAKVTDIAILVVAADDGVMPQTIEAINHAKSAEVPIIVAINKIDKPNAQPDKVKQQLSEHGLLAEDWGGQTIMVPVSAHKKIGLTDLLEMILLVAEMQELTANPTIPAQGTIIEAQLDKGKGPVATVLVQKGTLRVGDTILAGTAYGKVRAMSNERGELLKKAGPSTPVELLGLSGVPMAGDILNVTDEKVARSISEKRLARQKTEELQNSSKVSLDDIFRQIQDGKLKELKIVVKADVQGTIEALRQSLENIKNEEVKVVVVHSGVGAINDTDVMLASASNALIIGFNVRPDANARKTAENEKVDIRMYRVIYDAINDVEAAIKGMLAPKYKEVIQGRVEIRQVITISKMLIAGCYVLEGKITRTSKVRLLRDNIIVYEGELESLRRFKDDVKEVAAGYECGLTLDKFRDVKEGDIVEAYIMEEIKQD